MKISVLFVLCCLAIQSAFAVESNLVLTVDGTTYSNVTFGAATPAAVKVFHSSGIASLPLAKLPPELQQRFGYDPQKAADYNRQTQARQAAVLAQEKAAAARRKLIQDIEESEEFVRGKVLQITADGALITDAYTERMYTRERTTTTAPPQRRDYKTLGSHSTSVTTVITNINRVAMSPENEPIFVLGLRGGVDGQRWSGTIYPAGTHRYTSVQGAVKTVKCFALTPEAALRKLSE